MTYKATTLSAIGTCVLCNSALAEDILLQRFDRSEIIAALESNEIFKSTVNKYYVLGYARPDTNRTHIQISRDCSNWSLIPLTETSEMTSTMIDGVECHGKFYPYVKFELISREFPKDLLSFNSYSIRTNADSSVLEVVPIEGSPLLDKEFWGACIDENRICQEDGCVDQNAFCYSTCVNNFDVCLIEK